MPLSIAETGTRYMEVGVFHLMPWTEVEEPVGWPFAEASYDPTIGSTLFDEYIDQLSLADDLGYDFLGINEHHYNAYGMMPSPNVIGAALSQRTSNADVAVYGNVLPIRDNPIRVAEEYAMLDNLLDGRLRSGFVRGIPSEYAAYNIDPNESRARFQEAWHLIVEAWTREEPFDWRGDHYEYDDIYIWPRPVQDPHPPLWMPAESDESLEWAARHRVPVSVITRTTQEIAATFDRYREIAENDYGWTPPENYFGPARPVYVGETTEGARAAVEEHAEYFYDKLFGGLFRAAAMQKIGDTEYRTENALEYRDAAADAAADRFLAFDFEREIQNGEFIVGDADYVTAEIERQYKEMGGFGYFIGLFQFGTMPHSMVQGNLERFADDVVPHLRDVAPGGMATDPHPLPDMVEMPSTDD